MNSINRHDPDLHRLQHFGHELASDMIDNRIPVCLWQDILMPEHRYLNGWFIAHIRGEDFVVDFDVEDVLGSTIVQCENTFRLRMGDNGTEVYLGFGPQVSFEFRDWLREEYPS